MVCRRRRPYSGVEKIGLHCNVPLDQVISSPDSESIYTLPNLFKQQRLTEIVTQRLRLNMPYPSGEEDRVPFANFVQHVQQRHRQVNIAVTGKYSSMRDSYISITNAMEHTEPGEQIKIKLHFLDTTEFDDKSHAIQSFLKDMDGIIVPGGYGIRGTEGMIRCVQYARENEIPYLGFCLGFQLATIEFARNICNLEKAASTEFNVETPEPVISLLPEQEGVSDMGGTQRLGGQDVKLKPGTKVHEIYGADSVRERFRHRYEFNNIYKDLLEEAGMVFCGTTPDQRIMQILEYPQHPFFVATQFHPEWLSRPHKPHPLILAFVRAVKQHQICVRRAGSSTEPHIVTQTNVLGGDATTNGGCAWVDPRTDPQRRFGPTSRCGADRFPLHHSHPVPISGALEAGKPCS